MCRQDDGKCGRLDDLDDLGQAAAIAHARYAIDLVDKDELSLGKERHLSCSLAKGCMDSVCIADIGRVHFQELKAKLFCDKIGNHRLSCPRIAIQEKTM